MARLAAMALEEENAILEARIDQLRAELSACRAEIAASRRAVSDLTFPDSMEGLGL